jgi:ribosomal protein S18 acetylase RimI-like enzyme
LNHGEREGLCRLGVEDRAGVKRFLCGFAAHNAYLLGHRGALGSEAIAGPFWGFYRNDLLEGVACSGSNLVISYPATDESIEAFAQAARRGLYLIRVAIGEDSAIQRFMEHYGRNFRPISLERGGQLLFKVEASTLEIPQQNAELRPAEVTELEPVMEMDCLMIEEELGFNPFRRDPRVYRDGWLRRIRELRVWLVGALQGPYLFKVEQSAISEEVIQISGVYTALAFRKQGIAKDAIAQICRIILSDTPMVSLYVHSGNVAAVNLYRGLGFKEVGVIRSVWFEV